MSAPDTTDHVGQDKVAELVLILFLERGRFVRGMTMDDGKNKFGEVDSKLGMQ